ncbi:hypothetical protein BDA99DRAFT_530459 [Phascolomyces articulosus]|uniref:UBA domain-containing protein n=1 Tax=Phascolomyces articulosus TaxID=60185 RepID=A0AAD5P768_9FUNG|nr:hypothetical protein BDA99DRAFT_530459 [Phascolomyces articulosus]
MGDQGSIYSILQDVPVMVSHHYRLPKQIFIDTELVPIPDSLDNLATYPFSVEREALAEMAATRKKQQEERERLQSEYVKRQKLAARKIAPGFLDTDTRILQPEPLYHREEEEGIGETSGEGGKGGEEEQDEVPSAPPRQQQQQNQLQQQHLDYQKFEQGLAPPDPWDQPENDLVALRSILGPADQGWVNVRKPHQQQSRPPPPQQQQQPVPPPLQQPQHHTSHQQQQQQQQQQHTYPPVARPPIPAPALPPKPYGSSPSSAQTSPRAASVTPISDSPPPPIPPHPHHDDLIKELVNMGFSKPQAAEALEKNDHDLTKATNFLLDHGIG